jgi:hypothetical protein
MVAPVVGHQIAAQGQQQHRQAELGQGGAVLDRIAPIVLRSCSGPLSALEGFSAEELRRLLLAAGPDSPP